MRTAVVPACPAVLSVHSGASAEERGPGAKLLFVLENFDLSHDVIIIQLGLNVSRYAIY